MERHAVIEARARELLDAGNVVRREVGTHADRDAALGRLDDQRVFGLGHDLSFRVPDYCSMVAFLM